MKVFRNPFIIASSIVFILKFNFTSSTPATSKKRIKGKRKQNFMLKGHVVIKEYPRYENGTATHIQHLLDAYENLGKDIDVKKETEWNAMTTEDFAKYDAVIVVDNGFVPSREQLDQGYVYDPFSNAKSWGSAVQDGNVILLGTQELRPNPDEQMTVLTECAAQFTLDLDEKHEGAFTSKNKRTRTGAYISLGKTSEHSGDNGTNVTWLRDAFQANFATIQYNVVNGRNSMNDITAAHVALDNITSGILNGQKRYQGMESGARPYTIFMEWPRERFEVFALNGNGRNVKYTAPNKATGDPFILLRGKEVVMLGAEPSSSPSSVSSLNPSILPSTYPTFTPSIIPTKSPSTLPSLSPEPISYPSLVPSYRPSRYVSSTPSTQPTVIPTEWATSPPSVRPSLRPIRMPSVEISSSPSFYPSSKPVIASSSSPSSSPSESWTLKPSPYPSVTPNVMPSVKPSLEKSRYPSTHPTAPPTFDSSSKPTLYPSSKPSGSPSKNPTSKPSSRSTVEPSPFPLSSPSILPTPFSSKYPSSSPSRLASKEHSITPSSNPSNEPSKSPIALPTMHPTSTLTLTPTCLTTKNKSDPRKASKARYLTKASKSIKQTELCHKSSKTKK